jgi:hypothetical protein
MRLYESVLGRLRTAHGISDFIRSTIGVKQGCPLSPTLFGIYIDELETFLHEHIQDNDGCILHQVLISILLFVDDVVLLSSSPEGLQRQLDALSLFCDLRQLTIDLGKTKVMIFNRLKKTSNFQIGLQQRESKFFFSAASLDASRQYLNTSSLRCLELSPSGLR